jgi:purine catabolism regulator
MAMTVRRLTQRSDLGLKLLAGQEHADRTIVWAHAIELTDPTPYLFGGELVMTTGINLGRTRTAQVRYLARLSKAGVAALAMDTGSTFTHVPDVMVTAGNALGIPVLEVPARTPLIAITRAIIDDATAEQIRSVHRVASLQQVLARESLHRGAPAVVERLGRALPASVVLMRADGSILASSGGACDHMRRLADDLVHQRNTRSPRRGRTQSGCGGICVVRALRITGKVHGYLAVHASEALSAAQRLLVEHAMLLIAIEMDKPAKVLDTEQRLRSSVTRAALGSPGSIDAGVLHYFGFHADDSVVVAVIGNVGPLLPAEGHVQNIMSVWNSPFLVGDHGDDLVVVVRASAADRLADLCRSLSATLHRDLTAGVGTAVGFGTLAMGLHQAQVAAKAAIPGGRLHHFHEIDAFDIILAGRSVDDLQSLARPIRELDHYDRHHAPTGGLVDTLTAFLAHNGHMEGTAASLGIHRHTLRNRLAKARELTGCDFATADARAGLRLAVKARDVLTIRNSANQPTV